MEGFVIGLLLLVGSFFGADAQVLYGKSGIQSTVTREKAPSAVEVTSNTLQFAALQVQAAYSAHRAHEALKESSRLLQGILEKAVLDQHDLSKVQFILHKYPSLTNARFGEHGYFPLMMAIVGGHTDIISQLFAAQADIYNTNSYGETALHAASQVGDEKSVELLISISERTSPLTLYDFVNAESISSRTPLSYAVQNRHDRVANALMMKGALHP